MTRVVADTNIFVSAFQFGGLPLEFLNLAFAGSFQLLTSAPILDEFKETLRSKFYRTLEDINAIQKRLLTITDLSPHL